MIDLKQAIIDNEKTDVNFGITYEEMRTNKAYHNKLFYDKWGIPWKIRGNILRFSEEGYYPNRKRYKYWEEANMDGCELSYKKFFTEEEFIKIKPSYL